MTRRGIRHHPHIALGLLAIVTGCSALLEADTSKLGGPILGGADAGGTNSGTSDLCAAGCALDQRCSPMRGCVPIRCRDAVDCDDANGCNGVESCAPGSSGANMQTGCVAGIPVDCDDGVGCTIDSCRPIEGCFHTPTVSLCDDGIGCTNDVCNQDSAPGTDGCSHTADNTQCKFCHADGICSARAGGCIGDVPTNCSDGDACTGDTCDDALGRCMNGPRDDDGDGYSPDFCAGSDCNDDDASIHPDATEICNRRDDNCNGQIDEGCLVLPDTCGTAQTVTLASGHAVVSGALSDFASNYGTACGQSQGRDAVYGIPINGTSDIVIDSNGSSARVVLALAEACSDNGFALACAGSIVDNGRRSRLMLHGYTPPAAGTVLFLLVDGATGSETGAFNISIDVTPAKGDACSDVFELGACGTVVGFINSPVGQQRGSCQGFQDNLRPEAIMHVQGPPDESLQVSVSSQSFTPALYARANCSANGNGTGKELGCDGGDSGSPPGSQTGRAQLSLDAKAGSDIYLFVDGATVGGTYSLKCVP